MSAPISVTIDTAKGMSATCQTSPSMPVTIAAKPPYIGQRSCRRRSARKRR